MKKLILLFAFLCTISLFASGADDFIIKIDTTIPGDTDSSSVRIPLKGGPYSIDWDNNGIYDETTGDSIPYIDHTYSTQGEHIIAIYCNNASAPEIKYDNYYDEAKVLEIRQWGTAQWSSMYHAFYGCSNMILTASDTPDLSNVTTMNGMFRDASSFNQDISKWDVSNVTDMSYLFYNATSFNKNLKSWNVSNVTDMYQMFTGVSLSTVNYDALLNGWSQLPLQVNITLDAPECYYSANAETARNNIINNFSWTIKDHGPAPQFTVTANSAGYGRVLPTTQTVYYGDDSAAIIARPTLKGYHFVQWEATQIIHALFHM